jgi:hypothetical protein
MGTTLDVVLIAGPEAFVAHVGDSRTYLIREGRSSQITTDHTVAEVLVIEGKLTIEEAQVSPLRTILVNAIGVSADVGVEMAHVTLKRNDRLLLCSDGLHDYFPIEEEIAQKLSEEKPGSALQEMVELAKTRGGHDNITGVAIHVTEIVEAPIPAEMSSESTQPVDLTTNPFADEPTETAFVSPPGLPQRIGVGVVTPTTTKVTTPMRVVSDESTADTIPPGMRKPSTEAADSARPTEETKPLGKDAKPADAKADANTDEKADAKADAKTDAKADAKVDAKSDAKADGAKADDAAKGDKADGAPKDEAPTDDSVPNEIAVADTGRVQVPTEKDKLEKDKPT